MFRVLTRSVSAVGHHPVNVYESCWLAANGGKVLPFRAARGVGSNHLSSGSAFLCENKDGSPSAQNLKPDAEEEIAPLEEREEPAVDVGVSPQQVKPEAAAAAKTGKEGLLELLGAMKVEVTNKRKLKNLKVNLKHEASSQQKPKAPPMESTFSMFQKAADEASTHSETLDPSLVAAASAAASTLPNPNQAASELLRQLRKRKELSEAQKKGSSESLGVLIADMKVGKRSGRQSSSPAGQILFDDDGRGFMTDRGITSELAGVHRRRSKLSGKRLNIFSPATEDAAVESAAEATLWDVDFAHQLSVSTNQRPRNGLEEMIQWTKEGQLWQYPINNEAGLEEEASVPFHQHVFLEKHLEEGFPSGGPVRHFMELVVGGLSRNPFLTVQQKEEHIHWFQNYFQQKEDVLKEADVFLR